MHQQADGGGEGAYRGPEGCRSIRFIPTVLTTGTTIGGLLPMMLRGGTMYGLRGWTITGGLAISTFLTLIVVPVLFNIYI